jgi:hypothetical protein
MSDAGTLSFEYDQASALAKKLETVLELHEQGRLTRQERMEAVRALNALADLLEPLGDSGADPGLALDIPVGLARRLRDDVVDGGKITAALRATAEHLADWDRPLDKSDTVLLRRMAGASEREAAMAFRKLVRR